MPKNISWSYYWIFITGSLIIYYAVICCKYYFNEIKQVLSVKSNTLLKNGIRNSGNGKSIPKKSHFQTDIYSELDFPTSTPNQLFSELSQFIDEVKITLEQAAKNNMIKQEIICSLQTLSRRYSIVKESKYQSFINNYILIECLNHCSIHLGDDELKMIWL